MKFLFSSVLFNHFWHLAHFRNAQRHVARLYIFLVFMRVFWHLANFRNTPGMLPGYIFSRFHEHVFAFVGFKRFRHFVHFRNAQKHAIRLYIFLVFMSIFGILPIFEMHGGRWSGHIFSRFHARPQKSYQSKFQKCCPTKIKKQVKKKFSLPAIEKRLDFNKKRV